MVAAAVIFGMTAYTAQAQLKFGVKGSFNYTSLNVNSSFQELMHGHSGFNAGVALHIGLPLGLALQPEILYNQSGSEISGIEIPGTGLVTGNSSLNVGSIDVPVGIQWGIKIGPIRPYLQAVPYLSIPVAHTLKVDGNKVSINSDDIWSKVNYGIGLGAGIDIWKLQISCRYKWDMGNVVNLENKSAGDIADSVLEKVKDKSKMSGVELSVAFFF